MSNTGGDMASTQVAKPEVHAGVAANLDNKAAVKK